MGRPSAVTAAVSGKRLGFFAAAVAIRGRPEVVPDVPAALALGGDKPVVSGAADAVILNGSAGA